MLPIYFGDSQHALFGIYHPPRQALSRPISAVLCNPIGNEYVGAYRTMRVLADQLADAGISALRFDYFGTGDSAGAGNEGDVQRWLGDIDAAINEIGASAGTTRTSLIGLRLGGTLAAMAATSRDDIDRIVLWEPVADGGAHVAQHLDRHQDWLKLDRCRTADSTDHEALGFPMTESLIRQLGQIRLTDQPEASLDRVLLLFHSEERRRNAERLKRLGNDVEERVVESPDFWLGRTAFDQPLVSKDTVQTIVDWLTEAQR